jgi:prevent-host-death family protein
MSYVLPSEDIQPISLLGNQAVKLLQNVRKNRRPLFLTNKGKAAGVLLGIAEYERLLELIEFREAVLASEAEADRGEVVSHEHAIRESKRWIKARKK